MAAHDEMDSEQRPPERDEELGARFEEEVLNRLVSEEMGEKIAEVIGVARRAQETWHRGAHPDDGLRERKRRLTRQLISDAATTLFATRGFDNVKVSLGEARAAWAGVRDTGRDVQRVAQEAHREHHRKQRDQLRRGRPTERGSGP